MKIKKIGQKYLITICCPGCGYETELRYSDKTSKGVDYIPDVLRLMCSKCHTKFTITYNDRMDEAREAFMMAEDHDDSDLIIINEEVAKTAEK